MVITVARHLYSLHGCTLLITGTEECMKIKFVEQMLVKIVIVVVKLCAVVPYYHFNSNSAEQA